MEGVNGELVNFRVVGRTQRTIQLEGLEKYSKYIGGGVVQQVKEQTRIDF